MTMGDNAMNGSRARRAKRATAGLATANVVIANAAAENVGLVRAGAKDEIATRASAVGVVDKLHRNEKDQLSDKCIRRRIRSPLRRSPLKSD